MDGSFPGVTDHDRTLVDSFFNLLLFCDHDEGVLESNIGDPFGEHPANFITLKSSCSLYGSFPVSESALFSAIQMCHYHLYLSQQTTRSFYQFTRLLR